MGYCARQRSPTVARTERSEALDMGVPVLTLCGKRHGERSSFSILKNLGVTETIAQSGQEYV